MSQHPPMLSHVPPAIPYHNGRPGQNVPYQPQHYPSHPQPYPNYPYPYPMPYGRPPQQWQPYPMHMPMGRGYHQYPPVNPYPPQQHYQPMRPPPPHHHPSSSSIHSSQGMLSPSSPRPPLQTPSRPISTHTSTHTSTPHLVAPSPPPPPARDPSPAPAPQQFYPPLPWQSFEGDFMPRKPRRRRRQRSQSQTAPVELPQRPDTLEAPATAVQDSGSSEKAPLPVEEQSVFPSGLDTPSTSHPSSEVMSTQPTTPSSTAPPQQTTPKASTSAQPVLPAVPIRPAIPNVHLPAKASKKRPTSAASDSSKGDVPSNEDNLAKATELPPAAADGQETAEKTMPPPPKPAPKSWADLVRNKAAVPSAATSGAAVGADVGNQSNGLFAARTSSLAEVLTSFDIKSSKEAKIAFLEPRGLVNTGNMCYMNSILQILVSCVPFYNLLEKVGKQATHSFKSDTPMMDAMIMFMQEFKTIDAAISVDQLRMRLKDNELEQYGDAFIPEFVYDVIRRLPRFSSMRRGHQQDAEEFLGFLLEELHDECSRKMKSYDQEAPSGGSTPTNGLTSPVSESKGSSMSDDSGWLEVGPKQRAAITRSSGAITIESPVTKIFGGKLRSELRVPGMKNSVTLEPYQPLQLDIGAAHVSNILDALKGLTRSETLHGDFNSPRGPGSTATKQVTIETLPQVLILHLKRFQYDNAGGTQKIWKKIGYPLELEIPKEVFPQHKRGGLLAHGSLPKYRLTGVVYHHGKNASGGHYTVDVRRQDGREWIRIDDTIIRRIRSEDVAAGGSEEDPKVLAAALEQHKNDQRPANKSGNVFGQFTEEEDEDGSKAENAWSQVNGTPSGSALNKKWSGVANGNSTPKASESGKMTPVGKTTSVKDNKVAYILFYQKIGT